MGLLGINEGEVRLIEMSKRDELYANDAVWAAFYRDGKTLGDICREFDCGIYDVSPWLTKPLTRAIRDVEQEIDND